MGGNLSTFKTPLKDSKIKIIMSLVALRTNDKNSNWKKNNISNKEFDLVANTHKKKLEKIIIDYFNVYNNSKEHLDHYIDVKIINSTIKNKKFELNITLKLNKNSKKIQDKYKKLLTEEYFKIITKTTIEQWSRASDMIVDKKKNIAINVYEVLDIKIYSS